MRGCVKCRGRDWANSARDNLWSAVTRSVCGGCVYVCVCMGHSSVSFQSQHHHLYILFFTFNPLINNNEQSSRPPVPPLTKVAKKSINRSVLQCSVFDGKEYHSTPELWTCFQLNVVDVAMCPLKTEKKTRRRFSWRRAGIKNLIKVVETHRRCCNRREKNAVTEISARNMHADLKRLKAWTWSNTDCAAREKMSYVAIHTTSLVQPYKGRKLVAGRTSLCRFQSIFLQQFLSL